MLESVPNSLTKTGQFFFKRNGIKAEFDRIVDNKGFEKKYLQSMASNEQIEVHIQKRKNKDLKRQGCEEFRKRKLEALYSCKRKGTNQSPGFLYINSEKKQIIERSPEIEREKKPLPRPGQCSSPYKTAYPVRQLILLIPEVPAQQSTVSIPKAVISAYDNWKISNGYPQSTRFFIIAGNYPDIRKALRQRGWVENNDQESNFFDLKWSRNARIPQNLLDWQLYNHFPRNFELSAKWQLYEGIKKTNKVTSTSYLRFFPRSFRLDSKGFDEFFEHYKVIFAISILKDYKINPSQHIYEQIVVANIVCKRWANEIEKETYLAERISPLVMNVEWKILFSRDITEIQTAFQRLMLNPCPDLYSQTCINLSQLESTDPQFFLNGQKNIWIVKAGKKSRGRDISLFTDIAKLKQHTTISNSWVVQKYIENPMIIQKKKFDIRQWVLISSSDPLTIWIYKRSYLRFTLEDYTDEEIFNPYVHLTNNSISKTSRKFNNSEIKGCMWSSQQFQEYLIQENENGEDLWMTQIYPTIKKIVKNSLLAVGNLGRKKSFELLGYDFMIDERMNPWLLEINSSPAMDYSTVRCM